MSNNNNAANAAKLLLSAGYLLPVVMIIWFGVSVLKNVS